MKRRNNYTICAYFFLPLVLSSCYMVPIDSEGKPIYPAYSTYPVYTAPASSTSSGPPATSLPARLYPSNDIAIETGVVTGVVTTPVKRLVKGSIPADGEAACLAAMQRPPPDE